MPIKKKKSKSFGKNSNKQQIESPPRLIILETELDRKVRELDEIKRRVEILKEKNRWLNQEANRLRIEQREYKQFVSKKANLRINHVVSLSDYHKKQIEDLQRDKNEMMTKYQNKKEEFRGQLIFKSKLLKELKSELETFEKYENIRDQQSKELKRLENEVERVRKEHTERLNQMKLHSEYELQQQRVDQEQKLKEIQQEVDQEAIDYVYYQSKDIHEENFRLKLKLQDLIKRVFRLNQIKDRLEEENLNLYTDCKLLLDIKQIHFPILMSSSFALSMSKTSTVRSESNVSVNFSHQNRSIIHDPILESTTTHETDIEN